MYQKIFKMHADLLKTLAHPKRLEIINMLRDQELSVSDMQNMLELPQANLSQHLQLLRKYQVVKFRKDGKQIWYRLAHGNFAKATDLMREVLLEQYEDSPVARYLKMNIVDLLPVVADPVCGMRLSPKIAAGSVSYEGRRYYFCATGCEKKFKRFPRNYFNSLKEYLYVR